ncbi:EamA family transporter [Saccharopolyspora sp. TS4A08]|uniref:EamA family transporter n=1 Tax=Saccharopolyspora ipomoeae TaxID=3042027 RepID=A0ABT6PIZ5_9PSEU|nr:EamA family transporter [Saccharopolyspora sp. TS4A08]MDI2027922.1 EamA family transporter [Saccharopolyspora sp. TS4A08]
MTSTQLPAPPAADPASRGAGVALMSGSALSNQTGAAIGSLAFDTITPAGVVAVRQWIAALVLLATTRPRWREFTRAQWRLVLALAGVFAVINLALYSAVDRIGLGLAVTLEFLGPLAVALAGSRRRIDLACALLAATGVAVLMRPEPTSDYLGMGLALLAAACWAGYILLNRALGRSLPGAQGTATACGLSGLVFVPIGIAVLLTHPPTGPALGFAITAGVLSSAVPFLCDALALRRVTAPLFAIVASLNPVLAATTGLLILDEHLDAAQWACIAAIVAANTTTILTRR